jgi:hypothetical protein
LWGSFQKTDWLQGGGAPFLVQDSGKRFKKLFKLVLRMLNKI